MDLETRQKSSQTYDDNLCLLFYLLLILWDAGSRENDATAKEAETGIFKLLRNPGIDSKEPILPAYLACRAGTTTLFLLGS
jgi:hypothetical protein